MGVIIVSMILFGRKTRKLTRANFYQYLLDYTIKNHQKSFYLSASPNSYISLKNASKMSAQMFIFHVTNHPTSRNSLKTTPKSCLKG